MYLITIKRGFDFYVIADSPNEAQEELKRLLDKANWWYSKDREIINIEIISKEYHCFPGDKPCFSEHGKDLIIVNK